MTKAHGLRGAAAALTLVAAAAGCAATPAEGQLVADPYERINRSIHGFNVGLDRYALRPVSRTYAAVTPTLFQHVISNFVDHIRLPVSFVNNVLQADVDAALATAGRFGVNTIVGAGGLLDPATEFGLPFEPTDFGLTLASYGVQEGAFVMLPVFGPSTARDTVGRVGDIGLNPLTYVTVGGGSGETAAQVAEIAVPPVVARTENAALIDAALYDSEDSYVTVRAAFIQARRAAVRGGGADVEALPDILGDE
jgi:phospholipid-binding lipoprotein MlaA